MKNNLFVYETPLNHYVFVGNQILKVELETFNYFNRKNSKTLSYTQEVNNQFHNEEISNILKLRDCQTKVSELSHPASQNISMFLERNILGIQLQLTKNCNLRCSYCPYSQGGEIERTHQNINMSWDIAKKAIDFYYEHSLEATTADINFYGGEPFLQFKLMKKIVQYSKEKFSGKVLSFSVTSNTTLVNEEVLEFMEKNNFVFIVSLDGPKHINDSNRKYPNSTKSVYDHVSNIIGLMESDYPSLFKNSFVNSVVDDSKSLHEYLKLRGENEGLRKISINCNIVNDSLLENRIKRSDQFIIDTSYSLFETLLNKRRNNELSDLAILSKNLFLADLDNFTEELSITKNRNTDYPTGTCVVGALKLFVNTEGDFLACEKMNETISSNIIGNVNHGFDIEKVLNQLNLALKVENDCKTCIALKHCALCPAMFTAEGENTSQYQKEYCDKQINNLYSKIYHYILINEAHEEFGGI